jgi:hypothetical protein
MDLWRNTISAAAIPKVFLIRPLPGRRSRIRLRPTVSADYCVGVSWVVVYQAL